MVEITPFPRCPISLSGPSICRGRVVTIINLRRKLSLPIARRTGKRASCWCRPAHRSSAFSSMRSPRCSMCPRRPWMPGKRADLDARRLVRRLGKLPGGWCDHQSREVALPRRKRACSPHLPLPRSLRTARVQEIRAPYNERLARAPFSQRAAPCRRELHGAPSLPPISPSPGGECRLPEQSHHGLDVRGADVPPSGRRDRNRTCALPRQSWLPCRPAAPDELQGLKSGGYGDVGVLPHILAGTAYPERLLRAA